MSKSLWLQKICAAINQLSQQKRDLQMHMPIKLIKNTWLINKSSEMKDKETYLKAAERGNSRFKVMKLQRRWIQEAKINNRNLLRSRSRGRWLTKATVLFILFTNISFRQPVTDRRYFLNLLVFVLRWSHHGGGKYWFVSAEKLDFSIPPDSWWPTYRLGQRHRFQSLRLEFFILEKLSTNYHNLNSFFHFKWLNTCFSQ